MLRDLAGSGLSLDRGEARWTAAGRENYSWSPGPSPPVCRQYTQLGAATHSSRTWRVHQRCLPTTGEMAHVLESVRPPSAQCSTDGHWGSAAQGVRHSAVQMPFDLHWVADGLVARLETHPDRPVTALPART